MTQPQIPNYLPVSDPDLSAVLNAFRTSLMLGFSCHHVGTIQAFGAAANGLLVATATVDYVQTAFERQPDDTYKAVTKAYPPVIDAPALMLGGGLTQMTAPVQAGDPCLILFNDRDLNNWFAGARGAPVATARAHSFADALVLVGFSRTSRYSATHMLMTNGSAEVGVPASGAGQVRVANQVTTLYAVLSDLITAIEGITVTPGSFAAGGDPVTGTSGTVASTAALEAVRTALQGLLE